jgi:dihydrofolate reductase
MRAGYRIGCSRCPSTRPKGRIIAAALGEPIAGATRGARARFDVDGRPALAGQFRESHKGGTALGTIRVHEFVTLDGVIEAPSWTADYEMDPKMGEAIGRLMAGCEAILLGRATYEMFEPAWSTKTAADDPGAPFMNETTKYVVSSTLTRATWSNSKIVGPYDAGAIREITDSVAGGIYVSGSGKLVRALLADDLVDELHLFVFPLTMGAAGHLFSEDTPATKWALTTSETYANGVVYLVYRRAASRT